MFNLDMWILYGHWGSLSVSQKQRTAAALEGGLRMNSTLTLVIANAHGFSSVTHD